MFVGFDIIIHNYGGGGRNAHLLVEVAQQRCHMASLKIVALMRLMGSVAMDARPIGLDARSTSGNGRGSGALKVTQTKMNSTSTIMREVKA